MTDGRLVILSGPSCVGKSPLARALGKFYPELRKRLQSLVLYNSRAPRPGEVDGVDYHFRSREQIENLKAKDHFIGTRFNRDYGVSSCSSSLESS